MAAKLQRCMGDGNVQSVTPKCNKMAFPKELSGFDGKSGYRNVTKRCSKCNKRAGNVTRPERFLIFDWGGGGRTKLHGGKVTASHGGRGCSKCNTKT
jgi:hypothetical protein